MDALCHCVYFSFGAPNLLVVIQTTLSDEDFTYPNPRFALAAPEDGVTVEVTGDINCGVDRYKDFDGNDVTYAWVLYLPDSSLVVELPSNNECFRCLVTLAFATVDGLLEGAGLAVGESANFVWNVLVSDGSDTLGVAWIL